MIQRFGFANPMLVSDDGEIIAGHGWVEAAKTVGWKTVPTIALAHLSLSERRAYILADNKLALNAGWDREMLAIEQQALVDLEYDVELTCITRKNADRQPWMAHLLDRNPAEIATVALANKTACIAWAVM